MDTEKADKLEDETQYKILSDEELFAEASGETFIDIGSGTGFFHRSYRLESGKSLRCRFPRRNA